MQEKQSSKTRAPAWLLVELIEEALADPAFGPGGPVKLKPADRGKNKKRPANPICWIFVSSLRVFSAMAQLGEFWPQLRMPLADLHALQVC